MQRKRVSEETLKGEAIFWTLWRHKESCRNDMALSNESNKFDNNDPCMLRHTAGCSFYQGELELALNKSWVIDLDVLAA